MPSALPRSQVKKKQTWNSESVFDSPEAFDIEVKNILEHLPAIKAFQGRLGEGPDRFIETMNAIEALSQRAAKVEVYATMSSSVDATNQQGAEMNSKATSALAQVSAAISFVDPELLSIGESKLRGWLEEAPRLRRYEHDLMEVFKIASVDMTSRQPIEEALEVLEDYIDRLEMLTGK